MKQSKNEEAIIATANKLKMSTVTVRMVVKEWQRERRKMQKKNG